MKLSNDDQSMHKQEKAVRAFYLNSFTNPIQKNLL